MNTLRDDLHFLAEEAPAVDLAERAVRGAKRRRTTHFVLALASAVAVVAGGAAVLTVPEAPMVVSPTQDAVLPANGVEPASHAYYRGGWRLVTTSGQTFRLKAASSAGPVVISPDARRVAYYSAKDETFAVRDLASGRVWKAAISVPSRELEGAEAFLRLSPGGLRMVYTNFGGRAAAYSVLVDLERGTATELKGGWWPLSVGDGSGPVALIKPHGDSTQVRVLGHSAITVDAFTYSFSGLAPDGRTVARLERKAVLVTTDAVKGGDARVAIHGIADDFQLAKLGAWVSESEVTALAMRTGRGASDGKLYAISVRTGQARELRAFEVPERLVVPGLVN